MFEPAHRIDHPRYLPSARLDEQAQPMIIHIGLVADSRFSHGRTAGVHPVRKTDIKRLQPRKDTVYACLLVARVPHGGVQTPAGGSSALLRNRSADTDTLVAELLSAYITRALTHRTTPEPIAGPKDITWTDAHCGSRVPTSCSPTELP